MARLSNNQLKVIAMVAMTLDHIGAYLFPHILWLRIIGRLAFPIYAYMIAEGCRHTRNMGRYFGSLAAIAAVCQIVYFIAMDSLYMCIMVTFSLSVGLIWLLQFAQRRKDFLSEFLVIIGVLTVYFLCVRLPDFLPHTDYCVDYGIYGVFVPVIIYVCKGKNAKLLGCLLALAWLASKSAPIQWWSLLAIIPLALYNGKRGEWNMKWFFYLFYPAHLLVIHGISLL